VLCREVDNASSLIEEHRAREHYESTGAVSGHRGESAIELVGTPYLYELKLHSQSPCRDLGSLHHFSRRTRAKSAGMQEGSDARNLGERFLEQLQTLGNQLGAEEGQPRDIPTRPRDAGDQAVSDRIAHNRRHNGDTGGRLLCGTGHGRTHHDDEVDLETGQLCREPRKPLDLPVRSSAFNDDALPFQIAALAQSLTERVEQRAPLGGFK